MSTKDNTERDFVQKRREQFESETEEYRSELQTLLHHFRHDLLGVGALVLLGVVLLVTIIGPFLLPRGAIEQNYGSIRAPPGAEFLLGADQLGRSVLSRVVVGGRYSIAIGILSVLFAGTLGTAIGGVAGYTDREWLDEVFMRSMDVIMSFPAIVMGIAVMGIFGNDAISIGPVELTNFWKLILIIGVIYMPRFARITRGAVLQEKGKSYVLLSRIEGASHAHVFLRELLPNVLSPLLVMFTYRIGSAMILAAALSFLGIGIQPPTPSWGNMLAASRDLIFIDVWWVTVFPALALATTIICFNILGDSVRDALDPDVDIPEE
ncbi:ABC transporter permease [Haloarchaeobius salinus]|uniref:ABC transporter permease n=1 Tax=Haloarchaeobius salinus TaxID=1198298 RepID=UPI00210C0383|nr:ABC transporter permease [Haloarchaeobius salinus]